MEPLAGWCVAVTAERRADEQTQLLSSQGAKVLATRLVASEPGDDEVLLARTTALVAEPPDVVVANTAVGMRSWVALAWSWGVGHELLATFRSATVVARGGKAAAALLSEDVDVSWRSTVETLDDVVDHLLREDLGGRRVAVQLDGRLDTSPVERLREAGAHVVVPLGRLVREPAHRRRLRSDQSRAELQAMRGTHRSGT